MRQAVSLDCHPATPTAFVRSIAAHVERTRGDAMLALSFALEGQLARLRVPPPRAARRAERLWEHTCFEAFVAVAGEAAYHELNFAPSGEWAVYGFRGYRESAGPAAEVEPEITVHTAADRIELTAALRLDCLAPRGAPLRLGLSAVVEDESGTLSYWALAHPAGKPDFHHPDSFALAVDVPSATAHGGRR